MNSAQKKNNQDLVLGIINFESLLNTKKSFVAHGEIVTDAKHRKYSREYSARYSPDRNKILIKRADGNGDLWEVPTKLDITPELVAFFGLYSGDGSKGVESPPNSGIIKLHNVSFEQREVNLIKFVVTQFRYLFGKSINFRFTLGEDSVLFFQGDYYKKLVDYFGGKLPAIKKLTKLSVKDNEYLKETRDFQTNGTDYDLKFYYSFKDAMKEILIKQKKDEFNNASIILNTNDLITASLRRPFKKGSREYGKGSRSDGMSVQGTNGLGEIFLYILHSIEDSILNNCQKSKNDLIEWRGKPDAIGEKEKTIDFFTNHNYGKINGDRPKFSHSEDPKLVIGKWSRSKEVCISSVIQFTPKLAYVSGLYLAEGSDHDRMISMYNSKQTGLNFSFTSSEDNSLSIVISQIQNIIKNSPVISTWKVKVGSQYFTELVSMSNKLNVPMLRGGKKGQGKLKTVELSLAIKSWALEVCPTMEQFKDRFTHLEPTGAGVARIDFTSPSTYCKWLFPIFMSSVFSKVMPDPAHFQL